MVANDNVALLRYLDRTARERDGNPDLWAQYLADESRKKREAEEEAFQRDAYYLRQELARRYADRGNAKARRFLASHTIYLRHVPQDPRTANFPPLREGL